MNLRFFVIAFLCALSKSEHTLRKHMLQEKIQTQEKIQARAVLSKQELIDKMYESVGFCFWGRGLEYNLKDALGALGKRKLVAHSGTAATLLGCRGFDEDTFNDVDLWWPNIEEELVRLEREARERGGGDLQYASLNQYHDTAPLLVPNTEVCSQNGPPKVRGLTDKSYCEGQMGSKEWDSAASCANDNQSPANAKFFKVTAATTVGKAQLYCPPIYNKGHCDEAGQRKQIEVDIWDGKKKEYKPISNAVYMEHLYMTPTAMDAYTDEVPYSKQVYKGQPGKPAPPKGFPPGFGIRTLGCAALLSLKLQLLSGRGAKQKESDYSDIKCLCNGLKDKMGEMPGLCNFVLTEMPSYVQDNPTWFNQYLEPSVLVENLVASAECGSAMSDPRWQMEKPLGGRDLEYFKMVNDAFASQTFGKI